MMIIHGELATPLLDTVDFVETIAQDQTIEIVCLHAHPLYLTLLQQRF